jgi:probable rRNA maturation factor
VKEPPPAPGSPALAEPVEVDVARWEALAHAALLAEGAPAATQLDLTLVDEAEMAELNQTHMGHAGPTDVLSFPLDFADGVPSRAGAGDIPLLAGDLVICPAVARRNAPDHAGTFDDEMALLVVHGVLHLLGHDHAEHDERVAMQARERALLDQLHGALARDPWADADTVAGPGGVEATP